MEQLLTPKSPLATLVSSGDKKIDPKALMKVDATKEEGLSFASLLLSKLTSKEAATEGEEAPLLSEEGLEAKSDVELLDTPKTEAKPTIKSFLQIAMALKNPNSNVQFPTDDKKLIEVLQKESVLKEIKEAKNLGDLIKIAEKNGIEVKGVKIEGSLKDAPLPVFENKEQNQQKVVEKKEAKTSSSELLSALKQSKPTKEIIEKTDTQEQTKTSKNSSLLSSLLGSVKQEKSSAPKEASAHEKPIVVKTTQEAKELIKEEVKIAQSKGDVTAKQEILQQPKEQVKVSHKQEDLAQQKVIQDTSEPKELKVAKEEIKVATKEELKVAKEEIKVAKEEIKSTKQEIKATKDAFEVSQKEIKIETKEQIKAPKEQIVIKKEPSDELQAQEEKSDPKVAKVAQQTSISSEQTNTHEVKAKDVQVHIQKEQINKTTQNPINKKREKVSVDMESDSKKLSLDSVMRKVHEEQEIASAESKEDSMAIKNESKQTKETNSLGTKIFEAKHTMKSFAQELKERIEEYKPPLMKVKMNLNPKNLGEVDVTIVNRGNNLQVTISSNTTSTLSVFTQNMGDFKTSLVNMGFGDVNLNFNMNGQNSQNEQQQQKNAKLAYEDEELDQELLENVESIEVTMPRYV